MRYGIYGLGICVGLLGVAIAVFWLNDVSLRSFGILMSLGGAYLIKVSKTHGQMELRSVLNKVSRPVGDDRPGRLAWILGAVSLAASGFSFWLMNNDALHGYHSAWPIYAFTISGTIFTLVSSYILGMLVWKMFNH